MLALSYGVRYHVGVAISFTFIEAAEFAARWRGLGLTDDDLAALQQQIGRDPEAGPVMPGTGGLRKLRYARRAGVNAARSASATSLSSAPA